MQIFNNYYLFSDMDGTILNADKQISMKNIQAIKDFSELGGYFAIATGRSMQSAMPWLEKLPISAPCIFYNGALVYDIKEQKVLQEYTLDKSLFLGFIETLASNFPSSDLELFTSKGLFLVSQKECSDHYVINEKNAFEYQDIHNLMDTAWYKLLIYDTHEKLLDIQAYLLKQNSDYNMFFPHDFYFEITHKKASKGSGITFLKNHLANVEKIIAVGDYDNDIEMIKNADIGVAVENAQPCLLDIADYVCSDHNHDPIYDIFEYLKANLK